MAKKYSITAGQYRSLIRGGHVRECDECHQCLPKYKGRYPKCCPGCGGNVGMPIEDAVESILNGESLETVLENLLEEESTSHPTPENVD